MSAKAHEPDSFPVKPPRRPPLAASVLDGAFEGASRGALRLSVRAGVLSITFTGGSGSLSESSSWSLPIFNVSQIACRVVSMIIRRPYREDHKGSGFTDISIM
jgi:hypothetical protein